MNINAAISGYTDLNHLYAPIYSSRKQHLHQLTLMASQQYISQHEPTEVTTDDACNDEIVK